MKSGTDIYTKISPGSPQEFYLLHWSELPEGKNECVKISEECAVRLLRSLAVMPDTLAGMEFVNILHHLPAYYDGKKRSRDDAERSAESERFDRIREVHQDLDEEKIS